MIGGGKLKMARTVKSVYMCAACVYACHLEEIPISNVARVGIYVCSCACVYVYMYTMLTRLVHECNGSVYVCMYVVCAMVVCMYVCM